MPPDLLDLFEKVPGGSQTSGRRREEVDAQLLGHGPWWICHKNKVRGIRSLFFYESFVFGRRNPIKTILDSFSAILSNCSSNHNWFSILSTGTMHSIEKCKN